MQKPSAALDWNDLRYFLALADVATLTEAARTLGVSQPTASRRIAALERAVGTRLFLRTSRGYRLTSEGSMLRDASRDFARHLTSIERGSLHAPTIAGRVRVAATELWAREIVAHVVPTLRKRHPALDLEILVGNALVDLGVGAVDLALRVVAPESARLVAKKLGAQNYAVYGSHVYVQTHGAPADFVALSEHAFVWPTVELANAPDAGWIATRIPAPRIALRTNGLTTAYEAIVAGVGVGSLPEQVGDANGALVKLLPLPRTVMRAVYLVQHEDSRELPRVRAVARAMTEAIGAYLNRRTRKA